MEHTRAMNGERLTVGRKVAISTLIRIAGRPAICFYRDSRLGKLLYSEAYRLTG
jgi:hypothetical protein